MYALLACVPLLAILWLWTLLDFFGVLEESGNLGGAAILALLLLLPFSAIVLFVQLTAGSMDQDGRRRSPILPEDETREVLLRAMAPWEGMSWDELHARLWKSEKISASLDGFRAAVIEVGPMAGGYMFSGGNSTLFEMLRAEVENGGPIKIAATLRAKHRMIPFIEFEAREVKVVPKS